MKNAYSIIERWFEKLTEFALKIYGSSLTFIIACLVVLAYLANKKFYLQDYHDIIRDIILCITFLSFFIIQKAFNKFNAVMHLKMNELVAAHDKASNRLVNIEQKTEEELKELSQHYSEIAATAIDSDNINTSQSIEAVIKELKEVEKQIEEK